VIALAATTVPPGVTPPDVRSLVIVFAASFGGAVLARLHRGLVLPAIVVEILLGIIVGPQVLDIARPDSYITYLSDFGLVMLFFFAGLEVVERHVPRRAITRGTFGWLLSLALGTAAGLVLQARGVDASWWVLAVALSTTALGTLVPILMDSGLGGSPFGIAVLGTGVAGEFWPIVFISVALTGAYGAGTEIVLLCLFGILVAAAAAAALRIRPPRVVRVLQDTLHTTSLAAVRLAVLVTGAFVLVARDAGFDFVLGALAAGLIVGLVLDSPAGAAVRVRLEGIGFGLLIPIYFVVTGMTFDLHGFLAPGGLALAALFMVLLIVVRGASAVLWLGHIPRRDLVPLGLFAATGLPLIVAVVGIATDRGAISASVGASLIGAGMLSVLIYPITALRIAGARSAADPSTVPDAPPLPGTGES
jgi:Kef-type K+ transport system membrane component KefB